MTHSLAKDYQPELYPAINIMKMVLSCIVLVMSLVLWLPQTSDAHEIQPAIADLSFPDDGTRFELDITLNLEAILAGIGAEHEDTDASPNADTYNSLRANTPQDLEMLLQTRAAELLANIHFTADDTALPVILKTITIPDIGDLDLARSSALIFAGNIPEGSKDISFSWSTDYGAIVLRGPLNESGEGYTAYLTSGVSSDLIAIKGPTKQTLWSVFANYVAIGFEHILPKGLDHILFVVGLFLLSTKLSPLLWQITSFTLAHSITLALGILGLVTIPPQIVEPLIAASIVFICIENIFLDHLSRWRPFVIFGFGLLHGLGFASVLAGIGLAKEHFVTGLVAFNVGVELGQLTIIAACFLTVGFWFGKKSWYRKTITIPGSILIAAIGTYWFIERIFIT